MTAKDMRNLRTKNVPFFWGGAVKNDGFECGELSKGRVIFFGACRFLRDMSFLKRRVIF